MEQAGIENMSAYIRKMVIDGHVVKLDMPELRELTLKMKSISNSENQIAKRVNATGNIYETDIEEIKELTTDTISVELTDKTETPKSKVSY